MKQKNLPGEPWDSQPCLTAAELYCCAEQDGINSARGSRENRFTWVCGKCI